jgi:hypothetical protein
MVTSPLPLRSKAGQVVIGRLPSAMATPLISSLIVT